MNRKYTTQISALLMSAAVTAASCPPAALVRAVDLNETGTVDGYTYNLWNQNGTGDVEFTPEADGKLDLKFSPVESVVLAKGTKFESQYKWSSYGKITANYDIDYSIIDFRPEEGFVNPSALLGIYGWTLRPTTEYYTENPKTEYYVVEGWYKWRPPGSDTLLETVEIDGKLYDIYVTHTITMGGIIGTDNGWQQFWSIRRDSEIDESPGSMSGTVTLSEHFKVWEKYGFDPDAKLCDTSVNAEVYRCSGQITMNKGCEILTEYTNEQLAKTEPAEPAVTDPKPEITESEDTITPEITDVPETEPAVTEPTVPEEKPAVTDPAAPEESPAVTDPAPSSEPKVTASSETEITEPDEPGPPLSMPVITPGDTDGNGVINSADLIAMKKRLLNPDKNSYTIDQFDLNHDSKINVVDFIMLKSMISSGGK